MNRFITELFGDALSAERRLAVFSVPGQQTRFFAGAAEVEAYAREQSAARNVYYGVGLIRGNPSGRGKARDVAAIGALWADIDLLGPGRETKALPATVDDARRIFQRLPHAPSVLVDSGHGLHAYWLLKEPWVFDTDAEREQAARLAKGWHGTVCAAAESLGWHLENLGDLARVLRLPGTLNHKGDPPAEVHVLESHPDRRYNPDDFEPYLVEPDDKALPAAGENLVLRAGAEPPAAKMAEAVATCPKFRQTWNHERPDLADQSQSGFDLALASIAASLGWTDQETADLLIAARRHTGEKPEKALRPDYVRRTLALARTSADALGREGPDVDLSALLEAQPTREPPVQGPVSSEASLAVQPLGDLIETSEGMNPPIVHGLLREGETMNLIASPKVGKSWFVSRLAISVASGLDWLGLEAEFGRVLHIDNELHANTNAYRYQVISRAMGMPHHLYSANIDMVSLRGRLRDLHALGRFFEGLEPGQYKLIIIDAFYRTLPAGTDENDNGAMANLYNLVDFHAGRLGCAFVLVHHASKGNQSGKAVTDVGAGAGSQSRAADAHLILRPHEEDEIIVLESAARSWPPLKPRALRWQWPLFVPVEGVDTSALRGLKKPRTKAPQVRLDAFVETCVAASDPCSKESVRYEATEQHGLSQRHAEDLLSLAIERGMVAKIRCGAYVRYVKNRPGATGDKGLWTAAILAHHPTLGTKQVADRVGVSPRYVRQVRQEIGMPVAEPGAELPETSSASVPPSVPDAEGL